MFKTLDNDRSSIERKYHNPDEEYNPFCRMDYHGYDYDQSTGLSDEQIDEGLELLAKKLEGEPHPVFKARLFEFVLENTRIDVNEKDYFIGFYTWDRPITPFCVNKWRDEVYGQFPDAAKVLSDFDKAGIAYGGLDYEHTVPDWDSLMNLGFSGILRRAEKCYSDIENPTEKQKAHFEGMKIEYEAIIRFVDRIYRHALTKSFDKAPKIAECLKHLRDGAPTDTYEALQLIYLYFMLSESVDHYQVRSLGHGLDGTLFPFYKHDLESGKYTKDELLEFLGYFFMQWSAIDNYWGQPMYLGGMNADGSTKVNELSYFILDVYDRLGVYNPKIQIKINKTTPSDFIGKALEMIRHGTSSIVFCNDDVITKCLMARGADYEQATESVISGCYEYNPKAKGIAISGTYFNALKPVNYVLDNGFDTLFGAVTGLETGSLDKFDTFEKFYKAYLCQFEYTLNKYLEAINTLETRVAHINPSLMFSATCTDCVKSMTDALDGGLENTTNVLVSGLASAVDALMAVKEIVYENKLVTLQELKKVLDCDWTGYDALRHKALACGKYGNGNIMADNYAAAILQFAKNVLSNRRNSHGDGYLLEIHSARAFVIHGERTKATPDGRRQGEETSKNASPVPGADKNGVTALINSACTLDTTLANNGFCLDVMLHPSAVQGMDGMTALKAVLNTYMNKGGASIHFNIFDANLLRDAQKNPEKYKNLQVRVCGWNILWNNMDKKEQDAYILRAENL